MAVTFDVQNLEAITNELEAVSDAFAIMYRAANADKNSLYLFPGATSAIHYHIDHLIGELASMVEDGKAAMAEEE